MGSRRTWWYVASGWEADRRLRSYGLKRGKGMAMHGGCACGAVRYELARDELPKVYCCHCRDCQSRSGSAFIQTAIVHPDELVVTGPLITLHNQLPSGTKFDVRACGECISTIYSQSEDISQMLLLRAGSLDESSEIIPVAHVYANRKQPWIVLPDDAPQWEEAPSAEFFDLMGLA